MNIIVIRLEEINTERIQEGCPENNPPEDIQIILGDEKIYDAGDDKYDKEKEATGLEDPTPADTEIVAGDDKNDNVNDEKEHPDDMGDGDHVTTPDSIDIGIAEEKYKENETKDDGREKKTQFTLLLFNKMRTMKELMMNWKQKFHYSLLLLICRDIKVKVEKKNYRIDEETIMT